MLDRRVRVREVRNLGAANYLLTVQAEEQARLVLPGQFVMLKCAEEVDEPPLLRRPFSIFAVRGRARTGKPEALEILVKDVGLGTRKLAQARPGQELYMLGPQGRSYRLPDRAGEEPRYACLAAGGVGIAAMYLLARELISRRVTPVLFYGARSSAELVLRDRFERLKIQVQYSTEDGSLGERGLVTAPLGRFLKQHARSGVLLYACGPWAMMRAAHLLAARHRVPCQVSLEARMGCSLGACMGCVVRAQNSAGGPDFIRVCMEGPVLDSSLIDWETPPL